MKVIIDPAAIIELNEAAAWYRTQGNRKIAKDLADEFKRVVALLPYLLQLPSAIANSSSSFSASGRNRIRIQE